MGIFSKLKQSVVSDDTLKSETAQVVEKKIEVKDTKLAPSVLIKPLITEKSTHAVADGKYTFIVTKKATKNEVKKAVKEVYGKNVIAVSTINVPGKSVMFKRIKGQRSDWKKAIVTLKKGETIDVYEGI